MARKFATSAKRIWKVTGKLRLTKHLKVCYHQSMRTTEQLLGVAAILAVCWWHLHDANQPLIEKRDELARQVTEMSVQLSELEHETALASNPDLSWYEREMKKQSVIVTAYNTVPEQTDNSPCIAADGSDICGSSECVVANNALPFGTVIELEGFGECVVRDRMNSRYGGDRIDVSFDKDIAGAKKFGARQAYFVVK